MALVHLVRQVENPPQRPRKEDEQGYPEPAEQEEIVAAYQAHYSAYIVDHAGDGEEALARVRSSKYDLVICDLKMPRVDGMTLYRAIAAATAALARRVIFATGDVAGTDAERFLDENACRWLARPFRLADLLRAVRETLA